MKKSRDFFCWFMKKPYLCTRNAIVVASLSDRREI